MKLPRLVREQDLRPAQSASILARRASSSKKLLQSALSMKASFEHQLKESALFGITPICRIGLPVLCATTVVLMAPAAHEK